MAVPNGESVWKLLIAAAVLLVLFCIGIGHALYPNHFLKRSGLRKGGEMLTEFNRMGFRFVGIIFAAFSGCLLYVIASDFIK